MLLYLCCISGKAFIALSSATCISPYLPPDSPVKNIACEDLIANIAYLFCAFKAAFIPTPLAVAPAILNPPAKAAPSGKKVVNIDGPFSDKASPMYLKVPPIPCISSAFKGGGIVASLLAAILTL